MFLDAGGRNPFSDMNQKYESAGDRPGSQRLKNNGEKKTKHECVTHFFFIFAKSQYLQIQNLWDFFFSYTEGNRRP